MDDYLSAFSSLVADLADQFHYQPATTLEDGTKRFVVWYCYQFKVIQCNLTNPSPNSCIAFGTTSPRAVECSLGSCWC